MNTILVDVLQQPGTAFGVPPTASGPTQPQFVSASALSGTLFTIKSAGTAVTAASLTSIFPGSSAVGSLVLPANFFVPGRSLELTIWHTLSSRFLSCGRSLKISESKSWCIPMTIPRPTFMFKCLREEVKQNTSGRNYSP